MVSLFFFWLTIVRAKQVEFSNISPRLNVTGNIMDAHDGSYNRWDQSGLWYYYAMGYGECSQGQDMCNGHCGYGYSWIGVWTSPDLSNQSWKLLREARDDTWPSGVYFRVHVVYNPTTRLYILWVNINGSQECPPESNGAPCYLIGTSSSPEGPFTYVGSSTGAYPRGAGDFDILVDGPDAYIMYTAMNDGHVMVTEKLAPDWLSQLPSTNSGPFGNAFVEAPVYFKAFGLYYAIFDNCCCFCGGGSGAWVYTAKHPQGPWTAQTNIGCTTPVVNGCGCGMDLAGCPALYNTSLTHAQQNFVIPILDSSTGTLQYIWTGDRWQSAADGLKAHDLQYWYPLQWVNNSEGIPVPQQMVWKDTIIFSV